MTTNFEHTIGSITLYGTEAYYDQVHIQSMLRKKPALESAIETLEILAPPIAQVSPGTCVFHAEIERVSGELFRNGHYKSAALEAYICVIAAVRMKSGLTSKDGDDLMNHALGCDNRVPPLKFNSLSTTAERDEQKGFMYLFKGIVGLRNSKAHSNKLFNDSLRAHDYLSLASLAMRVSEIAIP